MQVLRRHQIWSVDTADCPHFIISAHPKLRQLLKTLLAQIRDFSKFILSLDKPITQTESRYLPSGSGSIRDPRATIVAQERIRSLRLSSGVDVLSFGGSLEMARSEERVKDLFDGMLILSLPLSHTHALPFTLCLSTGVIFSLYTFTPVSFPRGNTSYISLALPVGFRA